MVLWSPRAVVSGRASACPYGLTCINLDPNADKHLDAPQQDLAGSHPWSLDRSACLLPRTRWNRLCRVTRVAPWGAEGCGSDEAAACKAREAARGDPQCKPVRLAATARLNGVKRSPSPTMAWRSRRSGASSRV